MTVASSTPRAEHISRPLMLGAITSSPGTARVAARSLLAEWGLVNLAESVELVVGELVTNAVCASMEHDMPSPVGFRMSASGSTVLIEVWDDDPRVPVMKEQIEAILRTVADCCLWRASARGGDGRNSSGARSFGLRFGIMNRKASPCEHA